MTYARIAWTAAAAFTLCTGSLFAQAHAAEQAKGGPSGRVLSLYSSGIDGLFGDSMDAGLRGALRRLIVNGPSLPPETSQQARKALDIIIPLLLSDSAIAIDFAPSSIQGMPPFALQFTSKGVRGFSGDSIERRIQSLVPMSNLREIGPDPDHAGIMKYQTGGGGPKMWMGATDGTFVMSIPDAPMRDRDTFADARLRADTELLAGMRLNFSNLQSVIGMADMVDPNASAMLKSFGFMGPDALDIVMALGAKGDAVYGAGRVSNYGMHFGHFIPSAGITRAQFRHVPKSAACAVMLRFDLPTYMSSMIQTMVDAGGPGATAQMKEACDQFQTMLGIDVHTDVLAPLGDAFTFYMSDETGGNGITSGIGMISLKDADTMVSTLHRLQKSIDTLAAGELHGYVRLMRRDIQGCDTALSFRFPGIPVPLEPTIAVADGQLIVGLFPQSVAAAVAQFGASDSLLDAEGFVQAKGPQGIGAVEVVYVDERLRATQGYGCMAFLAAAIDNYTRPRTRPDDVAPPVLPPFKTLTSDMPSGLFIARMDGSDMVMGCSADRSFVGQATAGLGQFGAVAPMFIPLAVAVAVPAFTSAQNAAKVARSRSDAKVAAMMAAHEHDVAVSEAMQTRRVRLKTLSTAMDLARGSHMDVHRLKDLVAGGYITRHELSVPGHPDARYMLVGGGALRTGDGEPCMIAEPSALAIDRLCITPKGRIASMSP